MAIPDNAMKPTAADIEKGMSRNTKNNTPPVNAKGTPVKIIMASLNEPNARINKPIIITNVMGTTRVKRFEADWSF